MTFLFKIKPLPSDRRAWFVTKCAIANLVLGTVIVAPSSFAQILNPEIEQMESGSFGASGVQYQWGYFRNIGHPCGKNNGANAGTGDLLGDSDAYATFVVLEPTGLSRSEPAPLYVHSHGGLVGAFSTDTHPGSSYHTYAPGYRPPSQCQEPDPADCSGEHRIDQETSDQLVFIENSVALEDIGEAKLFVGLLNELRLSGNNFRFLFTSMCDHDVYSGEGVVDETVSGFNPYTVDHAGNSIERRADGLTTNFEALRFVEQQVQTSHLFLGGTSAGSIGSLALGYKLEALGRPATGIVADSHNDSIQILDLTTEKCYAFSTAHLGIIRNKIEGLTGPALGTSGERVSATDQNELANTPLLHVWDQNDVGGDACPDPGGEFGTFGDPGLELLYANDWHHIRLAQAVTANKGRGNPAHDASHNVWLCVADPNEIGRPCAEHSPTTYSVGNSVDHKTTINPDPTNVGYAERVASDYGIDYVNPVDYPTVGVGDYNKWIAAWIQRRIDGVPEVAPVPAATNWARVGIVVVFLISAITTTRRRRT